MNCTVGKYMTFKKKVFSIVALLLTINGVCNSQSSLTIIVSQVNSTQIKISWHENGNFASLFFGVSVSTIPTDVCALAYIHTYNLTINETTDGIGLNPSTKYYINVCASDGINSDNRLQSQISVTTKPSAPSNVQLVNTHTDNITVMWDDNTTNVVQYQIFYRLLPLGRERVATTPRSNNSPKTYTVKNLRSNTQYEFKVRALTKNYTIISDVSKAITGITLPAKPNGIKITVRNRYIRLNWKNAIEGYLLKNYTIIWNPPSPSGVFNKTIIIPFGTSSPTSDIIYGLQGNTAYNFSIIASNAGGFGEQSNSILIRTIPSKVNRPQLLNVSSSSATLTWIPVKEGNLFRTYTLSWHPPLPSGDFEERGILGNLLTVSGLESNKAYKFFLESRNRAGNGLRAGPTTVNTIPAKSNSPKQTNTSSSAISLSWNTVNESSLSKYYTIFWYPPLPNGLNNKTNISIAKATIDGLQSNAAYNFSVITTNIAGSGALSDSKTYFTVPAKANPPQKLSATATSITIRWNEKSEGSLSKNYTISWRNSTFFMDQLSGITDNTLTVNGLISNSAYNFSVTAVNKAGAGMISNSKRFFTKPGKPESLKIFSNETKSQNKIVVSWQKPNGGNAIDFFILNWNILENDEINSTAIPAVPLKINYTFVLQRLREGVTYIINIVAVNSAGEGPISSNLTISTPKGLNFKIKRNLEFPSEQFKLFWSANDDDDDDNTANENNNSNRNKITVNVTSTTTQTKRLLLFPLEAEEADIKVEPGNNYTISVSSSLYDEPATVQISSEPSIVTNVRITQQQNGFLLEWNKVKGNAEYIEIEWQNKFLEFKTIIVPSNSTSHRIPNIDKNVNYDFVLYSVITDVNSMPLRSRAFTKRQQALASPPLNASTSIAGIIAGVVAFVVIVVLLLLIYRKKMTVRKSRLSNIYGYRFHAENCYDNVNLNHTDEFKKLQSAECGHCSSTMPSDSPKYVTMQKLFSSDNTKYPFVYIQPPSLQYEIPSALSKSNKNLLVGTSNINSNCIYGGYIATKTPTSSNVNEFWNLIWQQRVANIVMLTLPENKKKENFHYWPSLTSPLHKDDFNIKLHCEVATVNFIIRRMELTVGNTSRTVQQIHRTAPIKISSDPDDMNDLIDFVDQVHDDELMENIANSPMVVHCRHETGDSTVYIAVDQIIKELKNQNCLDVYNLVLRMKSQWPGMVLNQEQYSFIKKLYNHCKGKKEPINQENYEYELEEARVEPIYQDVV